MDGNMRRLPPWMIAGASSGVAATSNRTDEGEIKHEAEAPKKKKKKRKTRKERDDSDIEETKKVEIRRRGGGVRRKIKEEEAKPSVGDGKSPEIIQSVTSPEDEEELTVDEILSFAHEYVKGEEEEEEEQAKEITLVDVNDESNMRSSKGETNRTRDPTSEDMINLLLGPFFKNSSGNN
ncbi:hypothetical protein N665_0186s0088 [Sinapis alba]|nr:hypothetical protein N665_0186s0088 [Sinapis alba]